MAKLTAASIKTTDLELTAAVLQLYGKRKALKALGEEEGLLKERIIEVLSALEEEAGTVFDIPGGLQVFLTLSNGNKTLNKDMLIDAGVLPSQIEKGYKAGKPFTKVEVKVA